MTAEQDPFEHTRMTLGEHLDELRKRLVRGLLAVLITFIGAFFLKDAIAEFAWRPYFRALAMINADRLEHYQDEVRDDPALARTYFDDEVLADADYVVTPETELRALKPLYVLTEKLTSTKPTESFVFVLKICMYAALVFGAPMLLWQLWQFVGAGLYAHERRAIYSYFPLSLLLFGLGVSFGYFAMLPYGLYFLGTVFSAEKVENMWTVEYVSSLTFSLMLILGLVFQLPVVMQFFCRLGLVEPQIFSKYRRHAILLVFVVSAMLTPPDPYTQVMMAVPMMLLYELGILLGKWGARPRKPPADALPVAS